MQSYPHLGSSAAPTICPEDDSCATPLARPAKTGLSPLISRMKPPTFSYLAMARRLSNASSPFSWPLAFRGYPETLSPCCSDIKQHSCGNETQGDHKDQACYAYDECY